MSCEGHAAVVAKYPPPTKINGLFVLRTRGSPRLTVKQ